METEQNTDDETEKNSCMHYTNMNLYWNSKNDRWGWDTLFVITVWKEVEKETKEVIDLGKRGADTRGIDALRKTASYPVLALLYFLCT